MSKFLILIVIAFGAAMSGCTIMKTAVDSAAGAVENRLSVMNENQYNDLAVELAAEGRSILEVDTNADGWIDGVEMKNFGLVEAKRVIKDAIKRVASGEDIGDVKADLAAQQMALWGQLAALLAGTFGWRGIRKYRNGGKKKA